MIAVLGRRWLVCGWKRGVAAGGLPSAAGGRITNWKHYTGCPKTTRYIGAVNHIWMIIRYAITEGAIGGHGGCLLKGLRKGVWGFTMYLVISGPAPGLRLPYVTKETRHGLSRMRVMIKKKKTAHLRQLLEEKKTKKTHHKYYKIGSRRDPYKNKFTHSQLVPSTVVPSSLHGVL